LATRPRLHPGAAAKAGARAPELNKALFRALVKIPSTRIANALVTLQRDQGSQAQDISPSTRKERQRIATSLRSRAHRTWCWACGNRIQKKDITNARWMNKGKQTVQAANRCHDQGRLRVLGMASPHCFHKPEQSGQ
jgi:hypothetical protein